MAPEGSTSGGAPGTGEADSVGDRAGGVFRPGAAGVVAWADVGGSAATVVAMPGCVDAPAVAPEARPVAAIARNISAADW